jgi:hypothetical protein
MHVPASSHRARRCVALLVAVAGVLPAVPAHAGRPATGAWRLNAPATSPPATYLPTMAYDAGRHETVLFGGWGDGRYSTTWVWDGSTWTQRFPVTSPPARDGAVMVYDAARAEVVLFGGDYGNGGYYDDTWVWDGMTWTERFPATRPPARWLASMAYDSARAETVLFGGCGPWCDSRTWTWDGVDWHVRTTSVAPSLRYGSAMTYDPARHETVLFGGYDGTLLADTWVWDGLGWSQKQTTKTPPPARITASMASVRPMRAVILFGGYALAGTLGDAWSWDGRDWTPYAAGPQPRYGAPMTYDEYHAQLVLFSGANSTLARTNDTWTLDVVSVPPGVTWLAPSGGTGPPARSGASIAYDDARHQAVLFGGTGLNGSLRDTWVWNGTSWTDVTPASPSASPSARFGAVAAYDAIRGKVVLYGGYDATGPRDDTWVWDGAGWTDVSGANRPPARYAATMAYDAAHGRAVLFGGIDSTGARSDTWTWDGLAWTQHAVAAPAARYLSSAAFDPLGRVVLFGGHDASGGLLDDTWTWDGSAWTPRVAPGPAARYLAVAAFDPVHKEVVLFGGCSTATSFACATDDTWAWDGLSWTRRAPATSPPARYDAVAAYDTTSEEVVLFGGRSCANACFFGETWTYA